jgi:putative redox protein
MEEQQITAITELDRSTYKTKIYAGGHFIYADEPEDMGGTDEGMPPAALLLASLGSCTAITIRMYADRKNIPLDSIKIHLAISKEDQLDEGKTITVKLEFAGVLTSEQLNRLVEISEKCPIHKILSNPIKIATILS